MDPVIRSKHTQSKMQNKNNLIKTLWEHSPISRTGLANITGLNKATVTNLMAEIESENMITNIGEQKVGVGRSQKLIMFNENYGISASILIRPRRIYLAVGNAYAKILWRQEFSYDVKQDAMSIITYAAELLDDAINKFMPAQGKLLGIGIGTGSLLRSSDHMMYAVHSMNWYNIPIGEYLRQRFKVPIVADTITNCATIGEKHFGAAKNATDVLYLNIGYGIGGGLILNNSLYRGFEGFAGDLGHFVIDPNGPLCPCGKRGCWEVMASELATQEKSFKDLAKEANDGNTASITTLEQIGRNLGLGIANIVRILNPNLIILGGEITVTGKWVMNPCKIELQTKLWPFVWEHTAIEFAELGTESAIIGTLTRVIELLFTS